MAINYPPNYSKTFGNVLMLDPNLVNVNPNIINGIPQYQDMFIFAELTAESRGRSVLETKGSGLYTLTPDSTNGGIFVNFIGNNQDNVAPNPNYLNFTTNWYDGSTGERKQTEGFGISNIKVLINSSFIPQVNIQFIDLRGLAFFNQENSPYRILFNFPPPIFHLTLKGYYGKPLLYDLHLVKYTSEFKAETGNFVIDAQFIAMTFAPLTDVLFRYAVNFPLINNPTSMNPSSTLPPQNTFDLILKLKSLYSEQNHNQDTTTDTQIYNQIIAKIQAIDGLFGELNGFKTDEDLKNYPALMFIERYNIVTKTLELQPITTVNDYNSIITSTSSEGTPQNALDRLIIAYQVTNNVKPNDISFSTIVSNLATLSGLGTANSLPVVPMRNALQAYRNKLIVNANKVNTNTIIPSNILPPSVASAIDTSSQSTTINTYISLDITDYYRILYQTKQKLQNDKTAIVNKINSIINNMIFQKLGIQPTIYNIFKIILNDVDTFFNVLRNTAYQAQTNHHVKNHDLIIGDSLFKDVKNTGDNKTTPIFAFPLVIRQQIVCNNVTETRIAPIELSNKFPNDPFPEIQLVDDFINTFTLQRNLTTLFDMRAAQNADGTYQWIPLSPLDSIYGVGDYRSPYITVDTSGGGTLVQPINLSSDSRINQVLDIILKRFYIISQNAFPYKFYNVKDGQNYVDFFSKSEAINLVASMFNPDYISLVSNFANAWQKNPNAFYSYINTNIPSLYTFTQAQRPYFSVADGSNIVESATTFTNGDAYVNKTNPNFHGFVWYDANVVLQIPSTVASTTTPTTTPTTIPTNTTPAVNVNNPVKEFLDSTKQSNFSKFFSGINFASSLKFTTENVFYINDVTPTGEGSTSTTNVETRFLTYDNFLNLIPSNRTYTEDKIQYEKKLSAVFQNNNRIDVINAINDNNTGNEYFTSRASITKAATDITKFYSIVDLWINQLSLHDSEIYNVIIDYANNNHQYNPQLSALVLTSNFGYTLSTFNVYPNDLNNILFNIPAGVQTPSFVAYYMGALVGIKPNIGFYNDIYDFFVSGAGRFLNSTGTLIFADIIDVNNQLATADQQSFQREYPIYYNSSANTGTYFDIVQNLNLLYHKVNDDSTVTSVTDPIAIFSAKKVLYLKYLSPGSEFYDLILQPLINRHSIMNFSQITFQRLPLNLPPKIGYNSLSVTNANSINKTINDNFFEGLFTNIFQEIKNKQTNLKQQKEEDDRLGSDIDILTQTYYSFKNINDKWISSPQFNNLQMGYPFNHANPQGKYNLIDLFVFVDRAMNPIGDTIINPAHLIEVLDDENATVFSVISQLLALNNFEFFPLQNFMNFQNEDWKSSFLIDTSGKIPQSPAFVCMYFGGSSSYPTGIKAFGGQFEDDGIVDLTNPSDGGGKDFNFNQGTAPGDCIPDPNLDAQKVNNPFFPYGQVRAYRVKFGVQNQSMFTNIKIDSKEYPETNESIKILSRLAGDNKLQAPTPKGQNLYNLYENRSYKATVTGFGNMMLQPTQYFQIENVPLFNGAYITLAVEHNIEPNKMTTSVTGTKILKYPVPRVLEASSILGFDGGNTSDTNTGDSSATSVTLGPQASGNQSQAQYNSMYNFKIR